MPTLAYAISRGTYQPVDLEAQNPPSSTWSFCTPTGRTMCRKVTAFVAIEGFMGLVASYQDPMWASIIMVASTIAATSLSYFI